MSESSSAGPSESSVATRSRLEQELARLREQRRRLATGLGGEDPVDRHAGDRGDQANQLEGLDDLARLDRRIREIEHRISGTGTPRPQPGLAEGTVVTLRFADGEVSTFRIVEIAEEVPAEEQDDVLTAASPLGRALVGCRAGDTITYRAPGGDVQAEVVAVRMPDTAVGVAPLPEA